MLNFNPFITANPHAVIYEHLTVIFARLLSTGQPVPWFFARDGAAFERMPDARIWINDAESLIDAAVCGEGVVQLLSLSLRPYIATGRLVPILGEWVSPGPPISVIYPSRHHQPAKISAFVKFVSALFDDDL